MFLKPGTVYKTSEGIIFIPSIDKFGDDGQQISIRLINIANWISLSGSADTGGGCKGKQLTNGQIACPDSLGAIEEIAPNLATYYKNPKKN